jgi:DNA-binding MarR family transcriptional regulator
MRRPLPFDPILESRRLWEQRWGAETGPSMAAITSLMWAHRWLLGEVNKLLAPMGLTFARYETLMVLLFSKSGPLPLGKIGERLQVHPTSVTNLVDRLEQDELVRRKPHESDRRATEVALTPKGRALAEKAAAVVNSARFALDALTPAQLDQITMLIRELRIAAGDFTPQPAASRPTSKRPRRRSA